MAGEPPQSRLLRLPAWLIPQFIIWPDLPGSGKLILMPPQDGPTKTYEQIVEEVGLYPIEAYQFVSEGLHYTVEKLKGAAPQPPQGSRHVSGQELSHGLKEFALQQWGLMARVVLERWNITRTEDFGRIVFALVENGWLSKTDEDSLEDFKNVFDFRSTFDKDYRIGCGK